MSGGLIALLGDRVKRKYGALFAGAVLLSAALAGPEMGGVVICMLRAVACVWPSAPLGPPEDPYAGFATREEAARYKSSPHNYTGEPINALHRRPSEAARRRPEFPTNASQIFIRIFSTPDIASCHICR